MTTPSNVNSGITTDIAQLSARGWVSLNQFSRIVGISYPTAVKLVKQNAVKTVRIGGINRIYAEELQRFMNHGNATTSGKDN